MITLFTLALLHLALSTASTSVPVPDREPQLASSAKLVALAYGAANAIYVRTSADEGGHFSSPVKVAEVGVLPLSRHRGPHIVFSKSVMIVTAITGNAEASGAHAHDLASDGDLYAWRSTDSGRTWSKAVRIDDAPAAAHEGLHTLTADDRGNVFAAWLDLRNGVTELYGAFSRDSGATWSRNLKLYNSPGGHICECCHPSASYNKDGSLDVMWRNVVDGSRDFYTMRSINNKTFGPPQKLGAGSWKINGCPMDGGGISHDGKRTVTAWRREADVFLDEPGTEERKIGSGKDVTLVANRGHIYVAWIEGEALKIWRDGEVNTEAQSAAFPSLAPSANGGALLAWETEGTISVKKIP